MVYFNSVVNTSGIMPEEWQNTNITDMGGGGIIISFQQMISKNRNKLTR